MPLLVAADTALVADGRSIQIGDLPIFNADDDAFKITGFDGWFARAAPDAVYVANGGGPGVVASGPWLPKEKLRRLTGRIVASRDAQGIMLRSLYAALPVDADAPLICYGNGLDVDLQVWVRNYDAPDITVGSALWFSFPLLSVDPYKYALMPLSGAMGVFTGQTWYRTYTLPGTAWIRTYTLPSSKWVRTYQQLVSSGAYPDSLQITSSGDVPSRRVTTTVVGPLDAGDWWISNDTTGEQLVSSFGLTAAQTLVIDSQNQLALLNGADVSSGMFGDWPTLAPGTNTFRLVAGAASTAFATVAAFEAYQ